MLNILLSFLSLNLCVIAVLYGIKVDNVKSIFFGLNPQIIEPSVEYNIDDNGYFNKQSLMDNVKTYFDLNLENDYKLIFYFKKDNEMIISSEPNIVQIKFYSIIYNTYKYENNVKFYINERSVTKDWFDNY